MHVKQHFTEEYMRITMNETRRGSEDGFDVMRFEKGQTYEVADSLARSFLQNRWATVTPMTAFDVQIELHRKLDRIFQPQPTRGSLPTNPATLTAKGLL